MGQAEVMRFLEECEKPVTRKQIAEALGEEPVQISHLLAKLLRWGEVEFIEYSSREVYEVAGYYTGRRTRFFFVRKE